MLPRQYQEADKFQSDFLRYGYDDLLDIILVRDRHVTFKLKRPYDEKIHSIYQVVTRPEIEMLMIHHLGIFEMYKKWNNPKNKPSIFVAEYLKKPTNIIKSEPFIREMFSSDELVKAIETYCSKAPTPSKGSYDFSDLLKR